MTPSAFLSTKDCFREDLKQSTDQKHISTWGESDLTLPTALPLYFLVPALYYLPKFSQPLVCYWSLTSVHCLTLLPWVLHGKVALYILKKKKKNRKWNFYIWQELLCFQGRWYPNVKWASPSKLGAFIAPTHPWTLQIYKIIFKHPISWENNVLYLLVAIY